jgi:hypothetical protein
MSADIERTLLVLHDTVSRLDEGLNPVDVEGGGLHLSQLAKPELRGPSAGDGAQPNVEAAPRSEPEVLADLVQGLSPNAGLERIAAAVDSRRARDRFAAAQALVLGVVAQRAANVEPGLNQLADAHVASIASTVPPAAPGHLVSAIDELVPLVGPTRVPTAALDHFAAAFGSELQISGDTATGQMTFSGRAAPLATLVLELATSWRICRASWLPSRVDPGSAFVTRVDIDICTNLPLDRCKAGINPMNWPSCNPYFRRVTLKQDLGRGPDGCAGEIKEEIGPTLDNGETYVTDLVFRLVEQPGLAAAAYDLSPTRDDDGKVAVDRGFVSVTDEGLHRRVRVRKIYRIRQFEVPHDWVCPLWVWQLALAGWWCG